MSAKLSQNFPVGQIVRDHLARVVARREHRVVLIDVDAVDDVSGALEPPNHRRVARGAHLTRIQLDDDRIGRVKQRVFVSPRQRVDFAPARASNDERARVVRFAQVKVDDRSSPRGARALVPGPRAMRQRHQRIGVRDGGRASRLERLERHARVAR